MTNQERSEKRPRSRARGAIGVIVDIQQRLLVIERSQTVRAPGRYCFPGGGIESGESEQQAVVRELSEELGVVVEPLRRLWESETQSGVALKWWLVTLDVDQTLTPNPREVARWFWMSPDEITQHRLTLRSNREFIAALSKGEFQLP